MAREAKALDRTWALRPEIQLLWLCVEAARRMTRSENPTERVVERAAIAQTLRRFLDAWNNHDARAFASTFTEDCDFTNVAGTHAHGRRNVESFHAPFFLSVFKDSQQTARIRSVRFLTPLLAQVDIDWQMTGVVSRDGTPRPDRTGLLDWVMRKQPDGGWLIEIMHNTDLTSILEQQKSAERAE